MYRPFLLRGYKRKKAIEQWCNRFFDYLQKAFRHLSDSLLKATAFWALAYFFCCLLAESVVQHYITPDHRICIGNLVKNVFYLFHNVILSFLVNNT